MQKIHFHVASHYTLKYFDTKKRLLAFYEYGAEERLCPKVGERGGFQPSDKKLITVVPVGDKVTFIGHKGREYPVVLEGEFKDGRIICGDDLRYLI